jgi:hypothetical protein
MAGERSAKWREERSVYVSKDIVVASMSLWTYTAKGTLWSRSQLTSAPHFGTFDALHTSRKQTLRLRPEWTRLTSLGSNTGGSGLR